nr:MAG TPA: hypothetical protein [Caudoviricetes sp.]
MILQLITTGANQIPTFLIYLVSYACKGTYLHFIVIVIVPLLVSLKVGNV